VTRIFVVLFSFALAASQALSQAPAAQSEVMAPIHSFFDAIAHRDKSAMIAQTVPNMEVMINSEGQLRRRTIDDLADRVINLKGGSLAEPIHDPVVHIDNDIASVWAPFLFTIDGKPSNCGTDVFTLLKLNGKWVIVSLSYNSQKNCELIQIRQSTPR
jgi:hypothetical protein